MGRPSLARHRKFLALSRIVGNTSMARGCLETIWDVAYENGDDLLGEASDVEFMADWNGDPGALVAALVGTGFIDRVPGHIGEPDKFRVHDLWDHAPDYVRKRLKRENERRETGAKFRSMSVQSRDNDRSLAGQCPPNGRTPAPAPLEEPSKEGSSPKRKGRQRDPALGLLVVKMREAFREAKGEEPDWKPSAFGEVQAVRNSLADDDEVLRRWRLFLADAKFWPLKNPNAFRRAFTHPKFAKPSATLTAVPPPDAIPVFK